MGQTILHIGMPKCGSTFLQKYIFTQVSSYEFIKDSTKYCASKNQILSDERLSGKIWQTKRNHLVGDFEKSWFENFRTSTARLAHDFSNVRVLFVIRPHRDLIISLYKQYIHEGGSLGFNEFRDAVFDKKESTDFYSKRLEHLNSLGFREIIIVELNKLRTLEGQSSLANIGLPDIELKSPVILRRANVSLKPGQLSFLLSVNPLLNKLPEELQSFLFKFKISLRHILQRFFNSQYLSKIFLRFYPDIDMKINIESFYFENDWICIKKKYLSD